MNKSIAYHGNPIKGLQIMGLLETRLLDFKNIIVLGLNEGKMPPTNPIQTMIPLDLRAYLKLPTPRDKQGLFAHHFYRLLHQSEKMWITYSSAKESIGSNEASRYLLQLELELRRRNSLINWSKLLYSIPEEKLILNEHRIVQKSPEILDRMDQLFQESVSASALNKYLSCPLDFYYRYVLGFGEVKEIEEDVESSSLGTFIHAVLEELYEPFARHDKQGILKAIQPSAITSYDIDRMLKEFPMYLENEFLNHFNKDKAAFSSGKNLLSFQMANELTKRFLESEREFLLKQTEPVFIEYLEVELIEPIELEINGSKKSFKLKGLIDRVDSIGGKIRIVDYKSGKVKDEDVFVKIGKSDDDYYKKFTTTKHALQLTMYSYLYRSRYGVLPTEVGIYSLINISNGFFALDTNKGMTLEEITEAFPEVLQELFSEMYDTEIPFEHTIQQFSYCNYCK
jgi:CRISPR/Cas system-associated exonuclease Cas4 (RecB family)